MRWLGRAAVRGIAAAAGANAAGIAVLLLIGAAVEYTRVMVIAFAVLAGFVLPVTWIAGKASLSRKAGARAGELDAVMRRWADEESSRHE